MPTFRRFQILLAALTIILVGTGHLAASPWYEDVPAVSDDPYGFAYTYSGAFGDLFKKGFNVGGLINTGIYHAILKRSEYEALVKTGTRGEEWSAYEITAANARIYRKFFADKGEALSLPIWQTGGLDVMTLLSMKLRVAATAVAIEDLAIAMINAGSKGRLDSARKISQAINPGDRFVRRVAIEVRQGQPYAHMLDVIHLQNTADGTAGEILLHRQLLAVEIRD